MQKNKTIFGFKNIKKKIGEEFENKDLLLGLFLMKKMTKWKIYEL
jgi:hypothetical protein